MSDVNRREILIGAAASSLVTLVACTGVPTTVSGPSAARVDILSAGKGSAFLPYAQAIAAHLSARGLPSTAIESAGSIENVRRLHSDPSLMATVFLGTASEGFSGQGTWTQGVRFDNIRALTPMYETSFQLVALTSSAVNRVEQVSGKRVGVGPAGGPAEAYFKGLIAIANVSPTLVTGTPTELVADLLAGRIDVLWQGAVTPIPSIKQIADASDATVFGLSETQQSAMLMRFPILAASNVAAGTYRNQAQPIRSFAAWNFVMANVALSEADAYWITRTILDVADPTVMHPTARDTRAENAVNNRVVPFHRGALRYYYERGIRLVI
jgi:uncharacterized protein